MSADHGLARLIADDAARGLRPSDSSLVILASAIVAYADAKAALDADDLSDGDRTVALIDRTDAAEADLFRLAGTLPAPPEDSP